MDITLASAQAKFVDEQVRSGRYADASDVVRAALRQFEARQVMQPGFLGELASGDTEAMVFIVMMKAAESAREDLKAIMSQIQAINAAKAALRERLLAMRRDCAANAFRRDDEKLDFSSGLGSERAYHQVLLPALDPDAPGGVRLVKTDIHPGRIERHQDLCVARDTVAAQLDSMSEMGEMESLRLQMAMDRMSKMMSTLSNLLRKSSDTAAAIIQNIK
jgi:putative addiction module CopG family antidote